MRYPVTYDWEQGKKTNRRISEDISLQLESFSNSKPHHVEKDSFLIQILQKVYEEANR